MDQSFPPLTTLRILAGLPYCISPLFLSACGPEQIGRKGIPACRFGGASIDVRVEAGFSRKLPAGKTQSLAPNKRRQRDAIHDGSESEEGFGSRGDAGPRTCFPYGQERRRNADTRR